MPTTPKKKRKPSRENNQQVSSLTSKIVVAWITLAVTLGVLIVIALSVPIGPGPTPGSSTTLLQAGLPWAIALLIVVGVLVLVIRWLMADRERERQAYLAMTRQHEKTTRTALRAMVRISRAQKLRVETLLDQGAELAQLKNGQNLALLPDGQRIPLDAVEAEYWEVKEREAEQLPPPKPAKPTDIPVRRNGKDY